MKKTGSELVKAAKRLTDALEPLRFGAPVSHVYNPLIYAWKAHRAYLLQYGRGRKRVVFFGMNPGPWGMVQTGVPFGEVNAVRNWLAIQAPVDRPAHEHPKRPVLGFGCRRSEVSGLRVWGLFAQRFGTAEVFFREHFVANYCPLAFMETTGRNRTPDKLPPRERIPLLDVCDEHLRRTVEVLEPEWLICIGRFAQERAAAAFPSGGPKVGSILHPSPANPAANDDWAGLVIRQLIELGVWG